MSNKKIAIFIFCLALAAGFIYFVGAEKNSQNERPNETQNENFESRMNDEAGVSVEVKPLNLKVGQEVSFQITFNTHSGDLDFDMAKISVLSDNLGNQYQPLEWQGGRGGHHLTGILVFPPLSSEAQSVKLTIKEVYGVSERGFDWNLN